MYHHGGQEVYTVKNLVEDYSVTTNCMGPSKKGLKNIKRHLSSIQHYPPTDKGYFKKGLEFLNTTEDHVIWGNGASELIDLTIRYLCKEFSYRTYTKAESVQFMEYERSCVQCGLKPSEKGDILVIINPNNPTGTYTTCEDIILNKLSPGGTIIVDESMLFWLDSWREKSMMQFTFSNVIVIHSWTKIFSCTGVRFGSVWSHNTSLIKGIQSLQVPWSVNILAYHYLDGCLDDEEYLETTRKETQRIRSIMCDTIMSLFPFITIHGEYFLSWLWIDCKSSVLADTIYSKMYDNGILVRRGAIGYNRPTFVRIAVRKDNTLLFRILEQIRKEVFCPKYMYTFEEDFVYGVVKIDTQYLLRHESVVEERRDNLKKYLENNDYFVLPSIVVCCETLTVLDGHHRLEIYRENGIREVPVLLVRYDRQCIQAHPDRHIDKNEIIQRAQNGNLFPPKSTKHVIQDVHGKMFPLISISVLIV